MLIRWPSCAELSVPSHHFSTTISTFKTRSREKSQPLNSLQNSQLWQLFLSERPRDYLWFNRIKSVVTRRISFICSLQILWTQTSRFQKSWLRHSIRFSFFMLTTSKTLPHLLLDLLDRVLLIRLPVFQLVLLHFGDQHMEVPTKRV